MSLLEAYLRRHRRIAVDSSLFICALEKNPRYLALAGRVLAWVESPGNSAVTSTVTMTELLVVPYRTLNEGGVTELYDFLRHYPSLNWVPVDLEIANLAAHYRAAYGLKTPDALQVATAVRGKATGLVTNDKSFRKVSAAGIEPLIFEDLL